MGQQPHAGGRYIIPIDSSGNEVPMDGGGRGKHTLTAGQTYYYMLGGGTGSKVSFHLTGYTAAAIVTTATVQDCDHSSLDVTDFNSTPGEWVGEDPTGSFVGADGAGWVPTNGVLNVAGGAVGGAMWHVIDTAAARHRVVVVMGATGGVFRGSTHGKD